MSTEFTQESVNHDLTGHAEGPRPVTDWSDLGRDVWDYLTARGAEVVYQLDELEVEVPRDTGPDAPRATWRLNGRIRVSATGDER